MDNNRPVRRMTLRQVMTHAEKCSRDLIEHCQSSLLTCLADLRDLSRPVRRRSHYPTMIALQNALRNYVTATDEALATCQHLDEQLQEIREAALRERVNRV
jgi:hypothetical protein